MKRWVAFAYFAANIIFYELSLWVFSSNHLYYLSSVCFTGLVAIPRPPSKDIFWTPRPLSTFHAHYARNTLQPHIIIPFPSTSLTSSPSVLRPLSRHYGQWPCFSFHVMSPLQPEGLCSCQPFFLKYPSPISVQESAPPKMRPWLSGAEVALPPAAAPHFTLSIPFIEMTQISRNWIDLSSFRPHWSVSLTRAGALSPDSLWGRNMTGTEQACGHYSLKEWVLK